MTTPHIKSEPILNLPPATKALCLLTLAAFLLPYIFPRLGADDIAAALALVPARETGALPFSLASVTSPVTYLFIHAGWLHLGINLVSLMAFGAGAEKALGGKRMLILYFLSGLGGALAQTLFQPGMRVPVIGASGAISGLFGAVTMMLFSGGEGGESGGSRRALILFILIWVGAAIFFGMVGMPGVKNPVAWLVHLGGFGAGLLLYTPLRASYFNGIRRSINETRRKTEQ